MSNREHAVSTLIVKALRPFFAGDRARRAERHAATLVSTAPAFAGRMQAPRPPGMAEQAALDAMRIDRERTARTERARAERAADMARTEQARRTEQAADRVAIDLRTGRISRGDARRRYGVAVADMAIAHAFPNRLY